MLNHQLMALNSCKNCSVQGPYTLYAYYMFLPYTVAVSGEIRDVLCSTKLP